MESREIEEIKKEMERICKELKFDNTLLGVYITIIILLAGIFFA
jgi:hypothetical protein